MNPGSMNTTNKRTLMKSILFFLCIFITQTIFSQTYNDGNVVPESLSNNWTIESNAHVTSIGNVSSTATGNIYGTLEINGDFTSIDPAYLTIHEGGQLIVHGNIEWKGDKVLGSYTDGGGIDGVLIVDSNANLGGININSTGVVIVGIDLVIEKGWFDADKVDGLLSAEGSITIKGATWAAPVTEDEVLELNELIDQIENREDFADIVGAIDSEVLPGSDWEGNMNNDWNASGNWANNEIPTKANNVTIPTNPAGTRFPLDCGNGTYYMWNLTLQSRATFEIPSGSRVVVYGDVTIPDDATLTINNSSSTPTSFIVYGQIIGKITFDWNYDLNRYWYIGHSISDASMNSYAATGDHSIYGYNGGWTNLTGGSLDTNPMTGYAVGLKGAISIVQHKGTVNNTDLSKTLIDGWQLIANPYPAYYQLSAEDPSTGDFRNTTGSVYVRTGNDPASRTLATFNVTTGISTPIDSFDGTIAPGQCFWVKKETAGEIYMKTNKRVHGTAALKSGPIENNILRIQLKNEYATDEAVLAINDNGQESISRLDSKQRMENGNKLSYIYTLKSGANTVINILPSTITEYMVPIGYKAFENGIHSIKINGLNNFDTTRSVYLEDKETGEMTDLRVLNSYEFEAQIGTNNDRFVLHFNIIDNGGDDLGTPTNIDSSEDFVTKAYISNKTTLVIECNWQTRKKDVALFDLSGQLITNKQFSSNNYEIDLKSLPSGLYLVKVNSENNTYTQKVLLKK